MKVSVVMATYNGSEFLIEQLKSIQGQSRKADEVYFADDCSSDNTVKIIEEFIAENSLSLNWTLQINEKNKGYAKNFLDAALRAKGELVFFSDQDDIWDQDHIKKMEKIMEDNPGINLLASNMEPFYMGNNTRKIGQRELSLMNESGKIDYFSMAAGDFHIKRAGCTMCVRKNFLEKIQLYWTRGWAHDDFVWKMAEIENSCAVLQYTSLKRRMHENNTTVVRIRTREWRVKQLVEIQEQLESMEKYCREKGIEDESVLDLIKRNKKAVEIRLEVVKQRRLWKWVKLFLCFKDCYPRIKGLYLDLYLAVFDSYSGV